MPSLRRSIGLFSFLLSTCSGFLATAESSTPIWLGRINLGVFKNCSDAYTAFEGAIKALGEEAGEEEEEEEEGKSLSVLRELKSSSSCFIKFSASEDQVEELQNRLDWLTEIEADIEVGHTGAPYAWGLDRVDQTSLPLDRRPYEPLYDGSGITIYVLDTGVYTEHQEFDGGERASLGINLVSDESADDLNGHGTHVASLAVGTHVGTAPGAQVVAVKVLNKAGKGSISRVIEGMHWVLNELEEKQKNEKNGRGTGAIMSMSLGGSRSTFFNSVVKETVEAGVGVVVAAGNDAQDACKSSPASAEEAITVGATKKGDSMADYSNYGSCVDLYAPGSSIEGALHGSRTSYLVMSGTSMATPAVSGALAGRLQKHSRDLAKATKDLLLYTSHNQVTNTRGNDAAAQLLRVERQEETWVPTPQPTLSPTNEPVEMCLWDNVKVCLDYSASSFGPAVARESKPVAGEVALALTDLCSHPSKAEKRQIKGKMVVIDRGSCAFVEKAANAERGGARAALFRLMNTSAKLFPPTSFENLDTHIPSALISYKDGQNLEKYYLGKTLYWGHGPLPDTLTKSPTAKPTKPGTDCSIFNRKKRKCKHNRFCHWVKSSNQATCELKEIYQRVA